MGAFASGLQGVGQAASDFGQAKFDLADWQQKQRTARLNEIIQGVRLQQIQQQLKQAQLPQSLGLFKGAQGEYAGSVDPNTGEPSAKLLVPGGGGEWRDIKIDAEGNALGINEANPAAGYVKIPQPAGTKFQTTRAENSVNELIAEGIARAKKGDDKGAQESFDLAQRGAGAKRATPNPTLFSLIQRAYRGDPEAKGELQQYQAMQTDLAKQRGMGYGAGRAMYQIQPYFDSTGNLVPLSNFDAIQMIHNGVPLTPGGHLSAKDGIAVQQFQAEMGSLMKGGPSAGGRPGIPPLRDTLKAFDNPADRLIFAQVGGAAGHPTYGQENAWARNVLNQLLNSGLSDEGRQLVVSLARLNETVGRMRSVLGLPSTDNAMQMTLALVPGVQTPDSRMAGMYVDNLEAMGQQAVAIPVFQKGAAGPNVLGGPQSPATSGQPPPGAKVRDYTQVGP